MDAFLVCNVQSDEFVRMSWCESKRMLVRALIEILRDSPICTPSFLLLTRLKFAVANSNTYDLAPRVPASTIFENGNFESTFVTPVKRDYSILVYAPAFFGILQLCCICQRSAASLVQSTSYLLPNLLPLWLFSLNTTHQCTILVWYIPRADLQSPNSLPIC